MKICWISPWFGNYRIPLYANLNSLSNDNFFIICSDVYISESVKKNLINKLNNNSIILTGEHSFSLGDKSTDFANKYLQIHWQPKLYSNIKSIRPNIIIAEGFGGWALAALFYSLFHRCNFFIFYERTAYVERNSPHWRTLYRRIVGKFADGFLINGKLTEQYLNSYLGFVNKLKVKGCMCADSEGLSRAVAEITKDNIDTFSNNLKLKAGLTYLFIGQIVDRKGIVELLDAWSFHIKEYSTDNLLIVGTGILLKELKSKYNSYNSIHFIGQIEYDNIAVYYAIANIFVMPTLEDNWCLVVPEAMACGKPIACSIYNGGQCELVFDNINGFSFDPYIRESIVETLAKFHKADLSSMGNKSKEIEANFTPSVSSCKIYDFCKSFSK